LYRARGIIKFPLPPFSARLKTAKKRFQDEIENGKNAWSKRTGHQTLTDKELAAWRDVETASQKFLDNLAEIEKLPSKEGSINGSEPDQPSEQSQASAQSVPQQQGQPEPQQNAQQQAQPAQDDFFKLRVDLDNAAKKLTDAVTQVRNEILGQIVIQQQLA